MPKSISIAEAELEQKHIAEHYDTIIIGAGVSGLMAAYILASEGKQVCILEQSSEIGGRVATTEHELADGSTVSLQPGAMWVHDSSHPLMMTMGYNGKYQRYTGTAQANGKFSALADYYFGKSIKNYLFTSILTIIYNYSEITYNLSWMDFVEKISTLDAQDQAFQDLIAEIKNLTWLKIYTRLFGEHAFLELLQDLIDDIEKPENSILESQNWIGVGDEAFLPNSGYGKIIEQFQAKLAKFIDNDQITIKLNTQVTDIEFLDFNTEIKTQNLAELFTAEQVILAIAPNHYRKINFYSTIDDLSTAKLKQLKLSSYLPAYITPAFKKKIIIILNQAVELDNTEFFYIDEYKKCEMITHGNSQAVHIVADSYFEDLTKDKIAEAVITQLSQLFPAKYLELIEPPIEFFADGESWFEQKPGFIPVSNQPNDKLIILGCLTGCDDSVHSNITRTCLDLGISEAQITSFLTEFFTPDNLSSYSPEFLWRYSGVRAVNTLCSAKVLKQN